MQHELEEVFAWLEARADADYQAGVLVLQKHCKNRSMVNGLLRKESPTNREKLVYELVKVGCQGRMQDVSEVLNHFAQAVQGAVPMVQQVADVLTGQEFPEQPEPEQVPEHVRSAMDALTELMNRVYQERCQLSNSLATLDPADGPQVVKQILSLEQQYNALAQKRRNMVAGQLGIAQDQAEAFGQAVDQAAVALANEATAPEATESAAPGIDRAELVKQRGNLRSNLSKARKSAETAKTEEKRSEYAQKAGKLQVELNLVEMQLAQPQANA
jgi:hypothetical protein